MTETAIILAGGFGTRLQSVVSELPKPMAPVNKQPFLNYQLNYLYHAGIKNVILSVGYLSQKIINYYGANFRGIKINYSKEVNPLGTGGGIRQAMTHTNEKEVFVLNGDSFFDVPLAEFYKQHSSAGSQASIAVRKVNAASRYGTMIREKDRIVSFSEKSELSESGIINGGIYILRKDVYFQHTPPDESFSIEKDFFEARVKDLKMYGFEFDGYFLDIGIPEDYTKAQDDFKRFKYR